ncbi:Bug family tripartite tricarboxylate transporter substrate binding protein [Salinisphaera aquimarina]|uniref:Bug family tripartite tricarboxylate transporter substrate binding protein n=1 Tax=Salinisphaera aquimarina TaxID=2094031 RepID=A0ABV7EP15_9GAMM
MAIRSALFAGTAALLMLSSSLALAFEPSGKVDCLAPADPGGGWDFTCRSVGDALQKLGLVPRGVQTTNMAGAGGGVAYAHTVSKRSTDDQLLVAASTATTTRLAQKQFRNLTVDQVNWVGTVGADYGIIGVAKDSKYKDLPSLLNALKGHPRAVKFAGGSAKGGWDHLKVLMAARAAGVGKLPKIPYLYYNNGGEALIQVIGGHVDAFTGDIIEAKGFVESGDLRVLAVFSKERLPGDLSSIPTAREQGLDVIAPNWRGFYTPKDIPDDAKQYWRQAIDKLYASDDWKQVMKSNGLMPFHMSGDEFDAFVHQQVKDIADLSTEIGLIK